MPRAQPQLLSPWSWHRSKSEDTDAGLPDLGLRPGSISAVILGRCQRLAQPQQLSVITPTSWVMVRME